MYCWIIRAQNVRINCTRSDPIPITSGSVIGSVLSIYSINHIYEHISFSEVFTYADDLKNVYFFEDPSPLLIQKSNYSNARDRS